MHLVVVSRAREPHVGDGAVRTVESEVSARAHLSLCVFIGDIVLRVASAFASLLDRLLGLVVLDFGNFVVGGALLFLIGGGSVLE